MKAKVLVCAVTAIVATAGVSHATITANNNIINSPVGIIQNNWTIDTDSDFLSAVVLVELTAGSVHDPFNIVLWVDGERFLLEVGDTFVTANDITGTFIAGGAGDLDRSAPAFATIDPQLIGITWASAATDDIGTGLPMGRFSFTDDAAGIWQLLFTNEGGDREIFSGVVINGEMVPEPATLGLLTLGGLALLQQRRR